MQHGPQDQKKISGNGGKVPVFFASLFSFSVYFGYFLLGKNN